LQDHPARLEATAKTLLSSIFAAIRNWTWVQAVQVRGTATAPGGYVRLCACARVRTAHDRLKRPGFRYIRLREPPYSDEDLRALAIRLRPPAYVYFRHEDEPTAAGVCAPPAAHHAKQSA
jgi:hypothetical protein